MSGEIILFPGCMYSGKSSMAMGSVSGYHRFGLGTRLYQPLKNTRDTSEEGRPIWRARRGNGWDVLPAHWYGSREDVLDQCKDSEVIGFDEWHWYPEDFVQTVVDLASSGKIVVASGLNYYFNGEPIESYNVLRKIEGVKVNHCPGAICHEHWGHHNDPVIASRTQMLVNGQAPLFDEARESSEGTRGIEYFPVCKECWQVLAPEDNGKMGDYTPWYEQARKLED
jgi:thymidine kinase